MTVSNLQNPLPSPTTLFTNAHLVGREGLYSVLVENGIVKSITEGKAPEVAAGTKVEDLEEQWLSPSMIDWHTHFTWFSQALRRLDFYNIKSAKEALELVRKAIDDPKYDEGGRLVAVNVRVGEWPDVADLNRESLDAISSTKGIFLIFNGYHEGRMNTPGLALNGLTPADCPDGRLVEEGAFQMWNRLADSADLEVLDRWVADEAQRAASLGVTEITDLEMDWNPTPWQRRVGKGFDKLRVHCGFYIQHIDRAIAEGYKTGDVIPNTHQLVVAGPHKIVSDGALGSRTAYCCDKYPNTNSYGTLVHTETDLPSLFQKATNAGLRLAVHAIGDQAMHLVLKTFKNEAAAGRPALPGSSIEHAQLIAEADIPTFADLGLVASVQPRHMIDDRELTHTFWPNRKGRTFPFKWFVDNKIPMKLGSDCPVSRLDPWDQMACAVGRIGPGETEAYTPEHLIDVKIAYAASTQNGQLDLTEGDRADLIVLKEDPLKLDATALREVKVQRTMLGGNWTYRRE